MRGHLQADSGYQERLLRFIENHDEPRAAATFAAGQARAAAVAMSTLQGARLTTTGSSRACARGSRSSWAADRRAAGRRSALVLRATAACRRGLRPGDGEWRLCACEGWPDNDSHRRLVSWCWRTADARHLVLVNLSDAPAQARVRLPWESAGRTWQLTDRLDGERFDRAGDEIAADGLYVALDAWASNFLALIGDD